MRTVIQRVRHASVCVDDQVIGAIDHGLLALVGIAPNDDQATARRMLQRLLGYRVFSDEADKMNLNLQQIEGGLLLVPNFTVMADTRKGMRPSFTSSAPPEQARELFSYLCQQARQSYPRCSFGEFAADMQVRLENDGPITLILEA